MLNHQPSYYHHPHPHLSSLSPSSSPFHPAPVLAAESHYHDPGLPSVGYRPLPLALQQPAHLHPQHHLHLHRSQQQHSPTVAVNAQQTARQHSLAAAAAAGPYQHPVFRQPHSAAISHRTRAHFRQQQKAQQQNQHQHQHQQSHHRSAMAASGQFPPDDDENAKFQQLSNEYEPEVTGPLVGRRQLSTAITTEYASADPVYQAKTAALPQKYSEYRTIRGDGKCGWRAVAFGYFEALIRSADSTTFVMEEARLKSMINVITTAGFDPTLIEDFAEETIDLLRALNAALTTGDADSVLESKFNDDGTQNYIITHMRTLTAAWMKTHESDYAPWLQESTAQYCDNHVLPVAAEIDNVGLVALKDVLLSPANITLEVLYLDRSDGSEANMHRFDPLSSNGYTIGFVRLLYRPGHYDILYKAEDLPAPSPTVYLHYASHNYHEPVHDLGVPDFMTSIPGISFANLPQGAWMSSGYSAGGDLFSPAPVQTCTQPMPTPPATAPLPQIHTQPSYPPATTPMPAVAPPTQIQLSRELTIRTNNPHASASHAEFHHPQSGGPFRPSAWQLEPDFAQATSQLPLQTSIFRNSHFNTAHFLNPEFQPEQWDPEDEYATATCSSKSSSRHNSKDG